MLRALLFALLLVLGLTPASAQMFERSETSVAPKRENAIRPELVLQAHATPGSGVPMAIFMRTTPGWHGYWLNPGDAGLPMSVEWTLPEGWKVEPLRYPVPHRLLVAGIVNYVYESDYAVLTRIVPPAGATGSHRVSAKMRWLACTDKICVPEQGEVAVDVPTSGLANPNPRFDDWLRALPRPLGSQAHFALTGGKVRLAIPLPANVGVDDPYFFPSDDGPIDYAAPQVVERNGDMMLVELTRRRGEPAAINGVLAIGGGRGLEISAIPGNVPAPVGTSGATLLWALLGALAGGVLLNLMPCVFPILGLKAMHLAKAGGDERIARRDALAYTLGAVLGTGALGVALLAIRASGEAAGWAFQLQDPRSILLLLVLVTAITLNLLRVFELPVMAGEANPGGSIGTGALAAFVATPCAGPFMGAALGAALLLPTWGAVLVFAALGLGLAIPFLAIAFIPALRTRLPKPGPWMARLQRILAVPMALTALACLWLLWRQGGAPALGIGIAAAILLLILLVIVGRMQHGQKSFGWLGLVGAAAIVVGGAMLLPAKGERAALADTVWSNDAVRTAQQSGRPVFVYFTADWCLTCKANEIAAIDRDETREAFRKAGVTVLVGDWTDGDPAITRFLETQGRAGVPLYLWYEPGRAAPEILPQVLTPGMLSSRADRPR
jgi:DsbC/DsbD-like thiol-disulfide interchange protein/cytochrome c biogenesis protein CcdA